jgi:hypothetical protein
MLRLTEVFITMADSFKAEQEPPWSYPHVLRDIFGSRAQSTRRKRTLTRANHRFVKILEVLRG